MTRNVRRDPDLSAGAAGSEPGRELSSGCPLKRSRKLVLAVVVATTLVVTDLLVGAFMLEDGRLGERPLPPFGVMPHPRQRAWIEAQVAALEGDDEDPGLGLFDGELGWTNRPGACDRSGRHCFDSIGARGRREYALPRPAGVLRVLCFGDSYTYGSEVVDGDDWPAQIEQLDPGVEALNFGVGGYGTDQALLRFRRVARGLEGQVVCIGLLLENIGRNVNRYRPAYYPSTLACSSKPRFVLEGGELELLPQPFPTREALTNAVRDGSVLERLSEHEYWAGDTALFPGSIGRILGAWPAYRRRQPGALWTDPDGEPFQVTLALLEAFHAEALASGAERAVVLIFPRQRELDARRASADGQPFWKELTRALAERSIPFIDLSTALLEPSAENELYVGGHLNRAGNGIVAATVLDWLLDRSE